jgi:hypothetical protein
MDKFLRTQYQSGNSSYIALFLPGFPGEYKDRRLFDDLKSYGFDIFSLVYPGTYDEEGTFSIASAISATKRALSFLRNLKKPILIVSYSFSTLFVSECFEMADDILGVLYFSPITDLESCIREDFIQTLKGIKEINGQKFNIDLPEFEKFIGESDNKSFGRKLEQLGESKIPLFFFIGECDRNVKTADVYRTLAGVKNPYKIIHKVTEGEHGLDTLYRSDYVKKAVLGLIYPEIN